MELAEQNPGLLEIDLIIGSDLIFNSLGLADFSNFLKMLKEVFIEKELTIPHLYIAHKARNDSVDSRIPELIESCGYFGE